MMTITRISFTFILMAIGASSSVSDAAGHLRQVPRELQTYSEPSDYTAAMLALVNQERAKVNLAPLCTNSKLQAAATRHSTDMATNNFLSHTGSDGSKMSQRVTEAGYVWTGVAENVAAGQTDINRVMTAWMNSAGHRRNILGDYTMFGTAYVYNADSSYRHYWTQNFAKGSKEACDSVATTKPVVETPAPTTAAPVTETPVSSSATPTDTDCKIVYYLK